MLCIRFGLAPVFSVHAAFRLCHAGSITQCPASCSSCRRMAPRHCLYGPTTGSPYSGSERAGGPTGSSQRGPRGWGGTVQKSARDTAQVPRIVMSAGGSRCRCAAGGHADLRHSAAHRKRLTSEEVPEPFDEPLFSPVDWLGRSFAMAARRSRARCWHRTG